MLFAAGGREALPGKPRRLGLAFLEIFVFQYDELVLLLVVGVFLVRRELGQGDAIGFDDLGHELVQVFGVTLIRGVVKVHRVLDREDR